MKKTFDVKLSNDGRRFDFTVEAIVDSKKICVNKCVLFDNLSDGTTNMALLDVLDDGRLSDSGRSGHGYEKAIFATVANVLLGFLQANPTETVSFEGSDPEGLTRAEGGISLRQRRYNWLLSRRENYELATNHFIIYGVYETGIAVYQPNSSANAFLIQLKR